MKKRYFALLIAICITAFAVAGVGAYIKFSILKPLGLYQDENIMSLPFMLLSDEGMKAVMMDAMNPTEPLPDDTQPGITEPSIEMPPLPTVEPPVTDPTEEPTEPTEPVDPSDSTEPTDPVPPSTEPPVPPIGGNDDPPPVHQLPDFAAAGGVDAGWFDDVLFIGDSRTVGMRDYARIGNEDYFCDVGMSVFNIGKKSLNGRTLSQLLSEKSYGKIFINLGINECGYPLSSLMSSYRELVNQVREQQPDAVIILQGIMTVGRNKAREGVYFEPENLAKINEQIKRLANWSDIYFIDVNTAFADSEGYLPDYMSADGCHLYAKYCGAWVDWIRYVMLQLGV